MIAGIDFRGIAILVAAIGSSFTAVIGTLNRRVLSAKPTNGSGGRTIFMRKKKKTIGDVVELLEHNNKKMDALFSLIQGDRRSPPPRSVPVDRRRHN